MAPVHWVALLGILILEWKNLDTFALASSATVDASGNVQMDSSHDNDAEDEPPTATHPPRMQTPISDFPDYWQEYTYEDIRFYFECEQTQASLDKPLPSMDEWSFMRSVYNSVVDPDKTWGDPVPPTEGYSIEIGRPEPPPFHAKASPGLGRGLFASRDIKKGEVVHDGTHSDVVFPTADHWRKYVFSLPTDLACDTTEWHWMQRLEPGGPYKMVGSINISILMNSAGDEWEMDESVRPNTLPRELYSDRRFYATRDIKKGEEILTDYDVYTTRWYEVFGPVDDSEYLDDEEEVSYISDSINADETTWPVGWERMSFDYIWNVMDCAPLRDDPNKPLPTIEDWTTMREVYTQVVDTAKTFVDPIPPTMGYTYGKSEDGEALPPPYHARTSPGKGRGLFASRNIKMGELVHRGGHESDVVFPDGMSWRRYVLTLPNRLACTIADWNWTQRLEDGGPLRMIVNLNIAAMMNSGGYGADEANVLPRNPTSFEYYATRDIAEGEEILMDYKSFETNWAGVGL